VLAVCAALTAVSPASPSALAAQEPAALRLSLDDALRTAEGSNPVYRRATNDADLNGIEMRTTWLDQLLPTASLQLGTAFTGNLQRVSTDFFGNPVANPTADWVYFSSSTQALSLTWNVRGPSLFQAHRRQSLVNERRDLARTTALTDVQLQVQRLYMDALEQRELMESEQELLEARRVDLGVAERLFSMGTKTRVEVLGAELEVERQALELQRQQAAYESSVLDLRTGLGTDDERPIELVDEPLPIFDPGDLEADALVQRALSVNPTLGESAVAVRTANLAVSEERAAWWPQLFMGVDVYKRAQTAEGGALFDPAFDRGLESNFRIGLSFPILGDFFASRERRAQANASLRNEVENERGARLEVERTVRRSVMTLRNQWETLRIARRAGEIAEEALRLARERYRLGTGTFEELRISFLNEADTRRSVITARHGFVDALLELEQAVGTSVRPAGSG
jgi:outer membrane protein